MSINNYTFSGNIGKDAIVRHTPNGDPVASFSVAVQSGYGERKATSWLNCNLWGKRAESLAPYLLKGAKVFISGEFTLRTYTDKAGFEKVSPDVNVRELELSGKPQEAAQHDHQPQKQTPAGSSGFDDFEDSIPF